MLFMCRRGEWLGKWIAYADSLPFRIKLKNSVAWTEGKEIKKKCETRDMSLWEK